MAKKVLLTVSEFTNSNNEIKKKRINVGYIKDHEGGGMSIALGVVEIGAINLAAQRAIMQGLDTVWLSIFEEDSGNSRQQ